ncbi:porin family protein [Salinibacter ruber]|uniref:porin family protein n=1 Tax=Salinibacter ruber TaxID=146919 RepID=UPI002168DD00|nr:porin family protein [Salinibacter ruber]MCS3697412.1 hypothetical protein [Salinibacter ruber]
MPVCSSVLVQRCSRRCTSARLVSVFALAALGVIVTALPESAWAQEGPCADTLSAAEEMYRARNYQDAAALASQCTDRSVVGDETAVRAYRLITLASLRQGALVQARSAVTNILQIEPEYTADPVNDPPSYDLFISMVREQVSPESQADAPPAAAQADTTRPGNTEDADSPPAPPAQSASRAFFLKVGGGISDYTGDLPIQNLGHPFDLQELGTGSGFPYFLSVELGYQFSPNLAMVLGFTSGNYPTSGYLTGSGSISDSRRHTPQLLGRYTFGTPGESLTFYVDGGLNVTFGGEGNATAGYGPSVGGGIDIPLSNTWSFFVESRFNFTLPDDAIDGTRDIGERPGSSTTKTEDPSGSLTGPFDSVNQLLGIGLRVRFGGAAAQE